MKFWKQIKNEWPEALCWGLTFNLVVLAFFIPVANWIVIVFGLYHHEPKLVPWEVYTNIVFGLLGMKGLNIIDKKTNPKEPPA